MKTSILLTIAGLSLSLSAHATAQPWKAMAGKYSVPASCEIGGRSGFDKAVLKVEDKYFSLNFYSNKSSEDLVTPVANFKTPASGTDGDVFWSVEKITENSFVGKKHFVRKGSDSWPDMEYTETTSLKLSGKSLTLNKTNVNSSIKGISPINCVLTSVEGTNEVTAAEIKYLTNKDLGLLYRAALVAGNSNMDIDQASFQIAALQLSKSKLTTAEIKEVLKLSALTWVNDEEIELKAVSPSADPNKTAAVAVQTATANKNGPASDYKELTALKKAVTDFLRLKKEDFKVIEVQWSESDSDGEGLLIIDENSNQVLYIGSGYFS